MSKAPDDELVMSLVERAMGQPPDARKPWLYTACAGDLELFRAAWDYVQWNSRMGDFLLEPIHSLPAVGNPKTMAAGDKLGPYEILALIGAGGMGEVYQARDTRLNRTVAIKVAKAEFGERFGRESRAVAALNHPHICTLFDVGPDFLVMEFIEGTPLKGPLPVEKAVEYGSQILDALDAAHRKGLTHRDLKPANVLVTGQGIKLLDFGLAKQSGPASEGDPAATTKGQILGTPAYMAPEQLQGKPADARSDLFAFGCVLYEILSGRQAFVGSSPASVMAAILEREPAPLDLDPPLGRVIQTCLAKDPDQRFQTARDLKRNLAWAIEQRGAAKPKPTRWPWAVAAAMLVAGALIGWAVKGPRLPLTPEQTSRAQLLPPPGWEFDLYGGFAMSPDGQSLAFVATAPGKSGLWIRPMDGTVARMLPGAEGARDPFWSPDSRSVAYFASSKLWRADAARGSPIPICDAGAVSSGGNWSADGAIVFSIPPGLHRVLASGGTPQQLTRADPRSSINSWPQVLPGGRILFRSPPGIYATPSPASGATPREPVRLVSVNSDGLYAAGSLLWLRGSTLVAQPFDPQSLKLSGEPRPIADGVGTAKNGRMAVAVSSTGLLVLGRDNSVRLSWLDRAGKPTQPGSGALGQPGTYQTFKVSPDARRVAVDRISDSGRGLWMVDLERDAWSRFTFLPGSAAFPVWSPDGRQVIFRGGSPWNLFRKDVSGAGAEQRVTESPNRQIPNDWSRDGRLILYYEIAPDTFWDLWVLPVTPDGKPDPARARPYLRTPFNERDGRFSPEPSPRWVAYDSDESGRHEIYIQAFPEPRGKFQISTGGGRWPEWSPDGKELYYLSPDRHLMAVDLKLDADTVTSSPPHELFAVPVGSDFQPYAVAPDGKRFLVLAPMGGAQPLEVVVNWPAVLKKGLGVE